ncbi:hypothetical protein MASR2M117_11290 [Paludibacter sp.]
MNKTSFFLSCSLALPLFNGNATLHAADKNQQPNILCIVCEDISPYIGCYGDPVAVTPNLDSFAKESIRFTRMYTTMGVSAPSRAALITGMYPTSIGANNMRTSQRKSKPEGITPYDVVLPEGVKCYTEFLRAVGYYCTNNAKTDYQFEAPITAWDQNGTNAHWKNAPSSQPFFSIFNLGVTHEFQVMDRAHLPLSVNPDNIVLPPYYPDDPIVRKDMAVMYSNITEMDKQFKALVDELKKSDRYNNTIIIWYSDNGGPLPRQKREIYESGTLVPFMVHFPDGYKAGTTDNDLHMFVDIPATILSLANVPVPNYMHGKAFLGKQKSAKRNYIYGARDRIDTFYDKQASVRDERYRLIRNYKPEQSGYVPIISRARMPLMQRLVSMHEAGSLNATQELWFKYPRPVIELYDVLSDPHEINNLAENPAYTDKLNELNKELDNWLNTYNSNWHKTENQLIEEFWPGRIQPQVEQPTIVVKNGLATLNCSTPGASIAYQINGKGLNEKHWFLYTKPFKIGKNDKITTIGARAGYKNSSLQAEAHELLMEWVETLLAYQVQHPDKSLDGGLLCPSCARVHGRCGDAVLPLMYAADKTGNAKYLNAAKRLITWMDNVHRHDGAWMNDVHVSDWDGTTVFAAIALYEALHHYGYLLDDSTKNVWRESLFHAGEFIYNNDFIFSRRREGMRNMNVNYSASATYALYAIGKEFDKNDYVDKAKQIASDMKAFFTENNFFLFGEGPEVKNKTKNGCLPIDLLYNVEESLPNMMSYAVMAKDEELKTLIIKSMDTHLEFMLPDGAWDNSWGTRSFKWTYWGGRTSDGFMGGYAMADADEHPEYYEAIRRNISLLKKATHNGLLYGGMNYADCNVPPCIHHTFGHAKALASFLGLPVSTPSRVALPRENEYGVKYFKDINSWLISDGEWRATLTGYDAEYKVKGTHPMGGVLSMLWSKNAGPVFAATMNQYSMIEAPNMQTYSRVHQMAGTPRIEIVENSIMHSNLDDLNTDITYTKQGSTHVFKTKVHLVDSKQSFSTLGNQSIEVNYTFDAKKINISCALPSGMQQKGIRLILPVISAPAEKINIEQKRITVERNNHKLSVESKSNISISSTDIDGRIFNPVPGFSFIPLVIYEDSEGKIEASIFVE